MSVAPADLAGPYRTVFDVGAFRGDFARACLAEWPNCSVHSFEPLVEQPAIPASETGDGRRRWLWHALALGNQCEMVTMTKCEFLPSSSFLEMAELHEQAFPYAPRGGEQVRVGMSTLDEFADLLVPPALLKIDVQGYELEVLKGAGSALDKFAAVVAEVSWVTLYEGAPTPDELVGYLNLRGFQHERRVDAMPHPRTGEILQSDELYVRVP